MQSSVTWPQPERVRDSRFGHLKTGVLQVRQGEKQILELGEAGIVKSRDES